jgi:hypothetical protein
LYFNHPEQYPRWWGKLLFYWRDSDWFVARGNARAIFTTGSLEANDSVFFSQAASRYLAFANNLLLGEQDVLIGLVSLMIGFLIVLVLAARIADSHQNRLGQRIGIFTAFIGLIFVGDQLIVAFAFFISSEYPTWIALLGITAYLINPRSETRLWSTTLVAATLAILVHFRPNSIFTFIAMLPILILTRADRSIREQGVKQTAWAVSVFFAILPLSLLHNLFYGARFEPFTGNASINYAFSWTGIWAEEGFGGAIAIIWSQLRAFMYWGIPNDPSYAIIFWGSQLLLILALAWRACLKSILRPMTLAALLPLTYVIPMLKFQFTSYYPRFIVAASLLCLVSALLIWPRDEQTAVRAI